MFCTTGWPCYSLRSACVLASASLLSTWLPAGYCASWPLYLRGLYFQHLTGVGISQARVSMQRLPGQQERRPPAHLSALNNFTHTYFSSNHPGYFSFPEPCQPKAMDNLHPLTQDASPWVLWEPHHTGFSVRSSLLWFLDTLASFLVTSHILVCQTSEGVQLSQNIRAFWAFSCGLQAMEDGKVPGGVAKHCPRLSTQRETQRERNPLSVRLGNLDPSKHLFLYESFCEVLSQRNSVALFFNHSYWHLKELMNAFGM